MRDVAILFIHLLVTIARLFGPGGTRSIVAESLLVKHQLLIVNRSRARAPDLRPRDRVIVGLCASLMRPTRLLRSAIVLTPSIILSFHRALVKRKYRLLFTPKNRSKPGSKGPSPELISAIVEMQRRNPSLSYQRIADQISLVFDIEIGKDAVRRVLARHYRPEPGPNGPSWLTFLGHSKDSLWSIDLFQCESLILKSHWPMVVMDQFTRRIIGFAAHARVLGGPTVCRMFNSIVNSVTHVERCPAPYLMASSVDILCTVTVPVIGCCSFDVRSSSTSTMLKSSTSKLAWSITASKFSVSLSVIRDVMFLRSARIPNYTLGSRCAICTSVSGAKSNFERLYLPVIRPA